MEVLEPKLCALLASLMLYLQTFFQQFCSFFFLALSNDTSSIALLEAAYGFKRQDERIVKHTQNKAATHFRTYTRHRPACKTEVLNWSSLWVTYTGHRNKKRML